MTFDIHWESVLGSVGVNPEAIFIFFKMVMGINPKIFALSYISVLFFSFLLFHFFFLKSLAKLLNGLG